jgi:hypothetical protein
MSKLRFVATAVWFCSWACAGGDAAPGAADSAGAQPLAQPEQPRAGSPATAKLADDADPEVLGGGENPTTEGSNTNWRPTEPWLDVARRPPEKERSDPRKPGSGQQGNADMPDQDPPSTAPGQQGESSSSGSGSGSNNSAPSPE